MMPTALKGGYLLSKFQLNDVRSVYMQVIIKKVFHFFIYLNNFMMLSLFA